MYPEVVAAARKLKASGKPVVPKSIAHVSNLSLFLVNRLFRDELDSEMSVEREHKARTIRYPEFCNLMRDTAAVVRANGWRMTVPALAEVSGISDRRIRSRLEHHPEFKAELGVVPSLTSGRYAVTERRR